MAKIVFCVIVAGEHLPGEEILQDVVVFRICLSILLHGVIANVWAKGIAQRVG
jgi:hypothetical protein